MSDIANQPSARGADWNTSEDNRNMKEKAAATKEAVSDLAGEAKRYASNRVREAGQSASEWASAAKEQAMKYKDQAMKYSGAVADYVQKNPYKTLAMAIGTGLVLGMILKRR